MNRFVRSLLKTAVCAMDQYSQQVDRASERVSELVDQGKKMIHPPEDHGLRNVLSFVVGLGVGAGAAVLFAPASGKEIRSSIKEKVQEIGGQTLDTSRAQRAR